jgi:hypothetical protein
VICGPPSCQSCIAVAAMLAIGLQVWYRNPESFVSEFDVKFRFKFSFVDEIFGSLILYLITWS